jgi:hypothetical protein
MLQAARKRDLDPRVTIPIQNRTVNERRHNKHLNAITEGSRKRFSLLFAFYTLDVMINNIFITCLNLNSVNQLIFVMVKCGVLFEVRAEFLNII